MRSSNWFLSSVRINLDWKGGALLRVCPMTLFSVQFKHSKKESVVRSKPWLIDLKALKSSVDAKGSCRCGEVVDVGSTSKLHCVPLYRVFVEVLHLKSMLVKRASFPVGADLPQVSKHGLMVAPNRLPRTSDMFDCGSIYLTWRDVSDHDSPLISLSSKHSVQRSGSNYLSCTGATAYLSSSVGYVLACVNTDLAHVQRYSVCKC
jgi:hypothetical protein